MENHGNCLNRSTGDSSNGSVLPRKRRITRMVDGHDSMETTENSEGCREKESRTVVESNEDAPQQTTSPTTTISTIAVQSGETRLVIALLQVRASYLILRR